LLSKGLALDTIFIHLGAIEFRSS